MGFSTNASTSASLGFLTSEADALLSQAKKYRQEMDALPPGDTRREVYEKMIRELLDLSRKLSNKVVASTSST